MPLYYINNGRSSFLKRRGKFFLKNGTPSVGGFIGHAYGVRVDEASPRGLWPPNGGRLCSLTLRGRQRLRR